MKLRGIHEHAVSRLQLNSCQLQTCFKKSDLHKGIQVTFCLLLLLAKVGNA
jgi:hypothetical protein